MQTEKLKNKLPEALPETSPLPREGFSSTLTLQTLFLVFKKKPNWFYRLKSTSLWLNTFTVLFKQLKLTKDVYLDTIID